VCGRTFLPAAEFCGCSGRKHWPEIGNTAWQAVSVHPPERETECLSSDKSSAYTYPVSAPHVSDKDCHSLGAYQMQIVIESEVVFNKEGFLLLWLTKLWVFMSRSRRP
jgi:hypothetical protein